ncbi:GerMN domain-containing protein [Catellatospora sp. KI3]|uniref:GerMN domain-containing protein n=1 Tax=Catellatospora sp. KI3 TaxID=3041620 RepID=UPI00248266FB|nr:GerMN domain-containing protein [Catellatospora sp. KI3]MDI1464132.1 GerMN domain-containing protein [Catellatospora sp. KI3]
MRRPLALVTAVCLLAAGCGVPEEDTAREIDRSRHPRVVDTAPTAQPSGPASERLFLVRDGQLASVQRRLPSEPDAQALLADLLRGPTDAEQQQGLGSALIGSDAAATVTVVDGTATVELPVAIEGTGRNDDVLAFGQIVCTLTGRRDILQVVFTRQGQRIGVPRPDAPLTQQPLRADDYASLLPGE